MTDDTKACPFCAETIKRDAKICRYCHMDLATGAPVGAPVRARSGVGDGVKLGVGMFIVLPLLIIVGLIVLAGLFGAFTREDRDRPSHARPYRDNSEFAAKAEKRTRGWHWAQDRKAASTDLCTQLDDPDEQHGCEAYVAQFAEKPAAP